MIPINNIPRIIREDIVQRKEVTEKHKEFKNSPEHIEIERSSIIAANSSLINY